MTCVSCKKKADLKHETRDYCKSCFCKLLERRVSKYLRLNDIIKKDDILFIKDSVTEFFIGRIVKGMPLKIVHKKTKSAKEVLFWTLDDEVSQFVESFFSKDFKLKTKKELTPLIVLRDDELKHYASFKGLTLNLNKKPNIYTSLKKLEESYPELFFSVNRSIKELRSVL